MKTVLLMDEETENDFRDRALERLLREFTTYLGEQKGFSTTTVNTHVNNIYMFAHHYLLQYVNKEVTDTSGDDINDFLSDWYLHKVINGRKSDVKEFLASFKKFFSYLCEQGKIGKIQLADIKAECTNPAKFVKDFVTRFTRLGSMDVDDEISREAEESNNGLLDESFKRLLARILGHNTEEDESNPEPSVKFVKIIGGIDDSTVPMLGEISKTFIDDFSRLVKYCIQHDGMRLSPRTAFFGTKIVKELNLLLHEPMQLTPTAKQPDTFFVHSFYLIAKFLEVIDITGNIQLTITPKATRFLELDMVDQFLIIFDAFWNKISWIELNNGISGRPEWAFEMRNELLSVFGSIEPGTRHAYLDLVQMKTSHDPRQGFSDFMLDKAWLYLYGVIPERVLPMFMAMGLVNLDYETITIQHDQIRRVKTVQVTVLGKNIFNTIAKNKAEIEDN
jgi:hypothetical protein